MFIKHGVRVFFIDKVTAWLLHGYAMVTYETSGLFKLHTLSFRKVANGASIYKLFYTGYKNMTDEFKIRQNRVNLTFPCPE